MVPIKELSIETIKMIIKLIQKGNLQWIVSKDVECLIQLCVKFGANTKEKKKNLMVDHERH